MGSGPGMAVGAALALNGSGRLPVAILGDGDYLMGVTALWTAVRTLEEQVELRTRMADRADAAGLTNVSEGFSERARESHQQAELIRRVLFTRDRQTAALASARTEAASHPKRRPKKTVRHR